MPPSTARLVRQRSGVVRSDTARAMASKSASFVHDDRVVPQGHGSDEAVSERSSITTGSVTAGSSSAASNRRNLRLALVSLARR